MSAPPPAPRRRDAVVVGGGPSGATAALVLARAGLDVLVLERARFPRFHVGESLLPANVPLLRELGLERRLADLPHVQKRGVEFVFGHELEGRNFFFADALEPSDLPTYNLERAPFDAMLLEEAAAAGAEVRQGTVARDILRLDDRGVELRLAGGETVSAAVLLDASGQATFAGKHLGLRRVLPELRKVAYFGHFRGVRRQPGELDGDPTLVMMKDGWFWVIPIDAERTSIGLVLDQEVARQLDVPPDQVLAWGLARCPVLRDRLSAAEMPPVNGVAADFSYRCAPFAGPGYFLLGDAATFVDPIFSTGICLGMMSAVEAARGVEALIAGAAPGPVRRRYVRFVESSSEPFFRLVRGYYDHAFRELLMEGQGPFAVHRAILSVLAGYVFPRPSFALRWRLVLFDLLRAAQRHFHPVAPREAKSLLEMEPGPLPAPVPLTVGG